jgi:hypothetical protein
LHHRSAEELRGIAMECGLCPGELHVGQEEEGVNLFLHMIPAVQEVARA